MPPEPGQREVRHGPSRTEFVFRPNGFGLDRNRMMTIGYQHLERRSREIGL